MKVHILGICGTFMAGVAKLMIEKGYEVSGSVKDFYPPMSKYLETLKIDLIKGYDSKKLPEADGILGYSTSIYPGLCKCQESWLPVTIGISGYLYLDGWWT